MTGRTHDLAAFTAMGVVIVSNPLPKITLATALVALIANMIGGIAPDVDQSTAPFWRNLPIGGMFGRFFGKILGGHRFLSHSVIGIVIFGAGFRFLQEVLKPSFPSLNMDIIWSAFMIGFFSHLVMDTFTKEGVPWLLPIPVKFGLPPIRHFRILTGGYIEKLVIFPGLILLNIYLYYQNYGLIQEFIHRYIR
ncbi:MAG TPA: metal-dependent hydrolase [Candidatus Limnocylindrales bacterium]|nr:metal-dependent hydrolase [Candidatus Limnocylindrales bacterium]